MRVTTSPEFLFIIRRSSPPPPPPLQRLYACNLVREINRGNKLRDATAARLVVFPRKRGRRALHHQPWGARETWGSILIYQRGV